MAIYIPIVMYGLRLFIVVLQELHCLPTIKHAGIVGVTDIYQFTKFHLLTLSSFRELKLKQKF